MEKKTVHIIGGGPSAAGLDFSKLTGTVIGVNDSYFNARCDYVVSIDGRWMANRWERLKEANAQAWLRCDSYEKHVGNRSWPGLMLGDSNVIEDGTGPGLHCIHGNNSGLVALNFAYHKGFELIFLYAFDMAFEGKKKHWYEEYTWQGKGYHQYPLFMDHFEKTAQVLKAKNIQVFNVGEKSKLPYFPKISFDEALRKQAL